jgi:hypothetical protein
MNNALPCLISRFTDRKSCLLPYFTKPGLNAIQVSVARGTVAMSQMKEGR